ncbi:MAG: thioredoxin [Dehalococcoidales bacterium]
MPLEISDQSFEEAVIKSNKPALVDFWAPWCGPCRMVAPVIDKLSEKYQDKFKFCKLNVDENPKTAAKFNVMSIPTIMLFKDGKVADTVVGAVPEDTLKTKIDRLL